MGMRLLTDNAPFDAQRCAAICEATSQFNIEHPPQDPTMAPRICKFYNTYILNKNYISQGQVCSMYTQNWDPSVYATNDGQWRGNDRYTISSSVFFHNATDVTTPVCPADITRLQSDADAGTFCTSFNSYVGPPATTVTTYTGTTTVEACGAPTNNAKRDADSGAVLEAVVAVYPAKVEEATVTETAPALVTIPAERLSVPDVYASATSAAIAQLEVSDLVSSTPAVSAAPSATSSTSISSSAAIVTTPEAITNAGAVRRAIATPQIFAGRDTREIASVCSRIITTGTPTVTVRAQATETTFNNCAQYPTTCQNGSPAQIIAGSFSSASENIDDVDYVVELPFQICIYDTCSSTVRPSSNGLITLGSYGTPEYANEQYGFPSSIFGPNAVLAVFWDDLYIYSRQRHYMDYSLCGDAGRRTVTFDWRMGRYSAPSDGPLYSFSATFFEDQPSRVQLKYFGTTDQGRSASIGMQGISNGQSKFQYDSVDFQETNIGSNLLHVLTSGGSCHKRSWSDFRPSWQLLWGGCVEDLVGTHKSLDSYRFAGNRSRGSVSIAACLCTQRIMSVKKETEFHASSESFKSLPELTGPIREVLLTGAHGLHGAETFLSNQRQQHQTYSLCCNP